MHISNNCAGLASPEESTRAVIAQAKLRIEKLKDQAWLWCSFIAG